MASNPLDGLINRTDNNIEAVKSGRQLMEKANPESEEYAMLYGYVLVAEGELLRELPTLLAVVKAARKECREHRASVVASTIRSAMSTAAEVQPPAAKYKPGQTVIHADDCPCHACEDYAAMMREVQP